MKLPLSLEAREALSEMLDNEEGFSALIQTVEYFVKIEEERLLKYNLGDGADQLVHQKARVEGSRKLANAIKELKVLRGLQASKKPTNRS